MNELHRLDNNIEEGRLIIPDSNQEKVELILSEKIRTRGRQEPCYYKEIFKINLKISIPLSVEFLWSHGLR